MCLVRTADSPRVRPSHPLVHNKTVHADPDDPKMLYKTLVAASLIASTNALTVGAPAVGQMRTNVRMLEGEPGFDPETPVVGRASAAIAAAFVVCGYSGLRAW